MATKLPPEFLARLDAAMGEKFITASGPGGQNVNKVATAVQLRVSVFDLGLSPEVYTRLKSLAGSKLTADGELLIQARNHRTQEANRSDARARMIDLIEAAHIAPAKRARTRLNRIGKVERLAGKKNRATIKKGRGRVEME